MAGKLSKPVYEALPFLYGAIGLGAFVGSYLWRSPPWSDLMLVVGAFGVIAALVIFLKRRDFRAQQRRYGGLFDDDPTEGDRK